MPILIQLLNVMKIDKTLIHLIESIRVKFIPTKMKRIVDTDCIGHGELNSLKVIGIVKHWISHCVYI